MFSFIERLLVLRYVIEMIARRIAGDIVLSDNPSAALRKWREVFGFSQSEVAKAMGVASSVLSDYEKGKRTPGIKFLKKFVEALIRLDSERGFRTLKKLVGNVSILSGAVIDMGEFAQPIPIDEAIRLVDGVILSSIVEHRFVYGYTILDSVSAITTLSGNDFWYIMGLTTERILVFTRVTMGRSPMVAVRVAPVRPAMVVVHGPRKTVDPLAVILAEREGIPLVLSLADSVDEIVERLRSIAAAMY